MTKKQPKIVNSALFKKIGIIVIKNFFKKKEILLIKDRIISLKKNRLGHLYYEPSMLKNKKSVLMRIENFIEKDNIIKNFLYQKKIVRILKTLFDDDPILFKEKINVKPHGSREDKLHADVQAGWLQYASDYISMLISIDPSNQKNGCLWFDISGNNSKKMRGELWKTLKINDLKNPRFKPFPLDVGDIVFFNGFVPHYSNNNLSQTDRTQMYITFNPKKQGDWRKKYYKDKIKSYPPNSQNTKKFKQVYKV